MMWRCRGPAAPPPRPAPALGGPEPGSSPRRVHRPGAAHTGLPPPLTSGASVASGASGAPPLALALVGPSAARRRGAPRRARRSAWAARRHTAVSGGGGESTGLLTLLSALGSGELDRAIEALEARKQKLRWARLPSRIVMVRHGQSEGNVDSSLYSLKGDSQLELSALGLQQAREAGSRLRDLVGSDRLSVVVSPFERAQQTLLGMYEGGFPADQVCRVRIDPRIREKEFGNFQSAGTVAALRVEEQIVGRFYYRLPNAESCADVLDRVSSFLDHLLSERTEMEDSDTCVLVTHGLTIRLILMEVLQWSVRTFESVFNPGNCHHVVLRKNMDSLCYELCPEESYPPHAPWSTFEVWIHLTSRLASEETEGRLHALRSLPSEVRERPNVASEIDDLEARRLRECSEPYTVVDYMRLPKPSGPTRGTRFAVELVLRHLVRGHGLPQGREELLAMAGSTGLQPSDVQSIDWFGDAVSHRGKMLRMAAG